MLSQFTAVSSILILYTQKLYAPLILHCNASYWKLMTILSFHFVQNFQFFLSNKSKWLYIVRTAYSVELVKYMKKEGLIRTSK